MINEDSNVQYLKGVGEKRAAALKKIGIQTVGDLVRYYPRTYRDWSKTVPIAQTVPGEDCCVRAVVDHTPVGAQIRKGLTLFKTKVTDGRDVMNITIFNNKYAAKALNAGEEYLFYGKVGGNLFSREMSSPEILKADQANASIHPIYPQSQDVSSKYLEKLIRTALDASPSLCREILPVDVRESLCLMPVNDAMREYHFPTDPDLFAEAKRRLVFEELFLLQAGLLLRRGMAKAASRFVIEDHTEAFYKRLPFVPTNAQLRAVRECMRQMTGGELMNRLLQGDVGSGKTMVAAALMDSVVQSGFQAAFMAPTEILASQHFQTISAFFNHTAVTVALLTGSHTAKQKREIKASVASGETQILIGTHALLQSDVSFARLGLVITDEQHRFGVRQRNTLIEKGDAPHTLVMSATPIPRTLALMIYGDLDVSVLDELPPGRQPVETYCVTSEKRERAYNYVKKHLDEGRQGYIVCPLVEDSDAVELAAAQTFAEDLANDTFREYAVGLLHGKMKAKDKERVMSAFAAGEIQLLVSTTVIEVGVDVPNAVIMVIENAERFGLSQLHQLRGRIGRGAHRSTCILISDATNETAQSRLHIMTQTSDGFRIADEDLRLRGPGNFFGDRQHGLPDLKIAMLTDTFTLKEANSFARRVLSGDPGLSRPEHAALRGAVERLFSQYQILN